MKRFDGGLVASISGIVLMVCLLAGIGLGYVLNIVRLFDCDFEAPYKAEVIRIIGIPAAPVGIIAGYLDLGR